MCPVLVTASSFAPPPLPPSLQTLWSIILDGGLAVGVVQRYVPGQGSEPTSGYPGAQKPPLGRVPHHHLTWRVQSPSVFNLLEVPAVLRSVQHEGKGRRPL